MQNDCFPDAIAEWEKRAISFIAEINPRYPIKKGEELPFIEMASVAERFGGIQRLDTRKLEGSGLSRFAVGDTLFAKITPCPENGKIAFIGSLPAKYGIGSTEFIVLSPKQNCNPRFLYHLVCDHAVRARATSRMEGSTGRQRVPEDVFEKRLLVPVPRKNEQTAIAQVLDRVDHVINRTHIAVTAAENAKRAVVQRFFFSALGNTAYADRPTKKLPREWVLVPTANLLAGDPKNGVSPPTNAQPPGIPTFSIGAIRGGRIDLEDPQHLKFAQLSDRAADAYKVSSGDVLIVRGNANPDLVGKAAMIRDFPAKCIYPDITKRVVFRKTGDNCVTPAFAVIAWNHSLVHNQVLRRAKTSNGTLKINSRDIKQIIMPVPPEREQQILVKLVAGLEFKIEQLLNVLDSHQAMKQALMRGLFTGHLRVNRLALQSAATV
jgi:type I restriction enzyme S subunit